MTANGSGRGSFIAVVIVVVLSIPNFYLAMFGIPRFAAIFYDMFGDGALPQITSMVLSFRLPLVALACVWPLAASIIYRRSGSVPLLSALLAAVTLQVSITTLALFLPLSTTIISIQSPK